MNSQIRIIVQFDNSKKIILFNSEDILEAIIALSLEKFGISKSQKSLYSLILAKDECLIESREEIRDGDHLLLQKQEEFYERIDSRNLLEYEENSMEIVNLSHSKSISRSESLNESPDTSEINDSYNDGSEATHISSADQSSDENEERKGEIVTIQDE